MDIKAAIVGALFGAGVCGGVWWLTERSRGTVPLPVASTETAARGQSAVQSRAAVPQNGLDVDMQKTGPITHAPESEPFTDPLDTEISTSNEARARRWKEERDINWSYGTEQAIRQYLATHKLAAKFEIVQVECRTSFCEIEASGYTDDAWSAWTQIMQDVRNQPWSEFGSTGSSASTQSGRPSFIGTFFRDQQTAESKPQ